MSRQVESRDVRNCRIFSQATSVLAVLAGSLALLGWLLGITALTGVLPGSATMKPNTALCFVLAGLSLWLIQLQRGELYSPRKQRIQVGRIISGVVGLAGLLTLAEYLFHLDLGLDELLFSKTLLAAGVAHPGRMAAATALGFVLFAGSVLLSTTRHPNLAQSLALLTALDGFVACIGYLLNARSLYAVPAYSSMALHTAILFFLAGLATAAARPEAGLMAVVTSEHLGGVMVRRVLPLILVLVMFLGWLRWRGQLIGLYGTEFGIALLILSEVVVFVAVLWFSAMRLNRLDQAHQQAQSQRLLLAAIVESSEDAILSKDLSGTITSWNRGAERMYGYSAAEIIGKPVSILMPEEVQEETTQFLRTITSGQIVTAEDTVRRRKDGTLVHVSLVISPVRDLEGQIVGASSIAHNVTERKQREAELRESEERIRLFMEHAPAALAMFDREMRYLHVSRRWRADYGLDDRDLRGVSHYEVFPEVPERWKEAHRRGLAGEIQREENDRFERADGSVQYLRWEIRPWRETTGGIGGILIFAEEITERKRAEELLRKSEENYRTLFDSMDEGFCTIEVLFNENKEPVDYLFLDVNPAFEKQTGIQNARGRRMREIAPAHEEFWFATYGKIALTGEPARFEHVAAQLHRCYDVHAFRVGNPVARTVAIFFDDITDRKQVEESLFRSEERFSKAFRNNPLAITISTEADGRYLDVNDAFLTLLGYRRSDVIGRTARELCFWAEPMDRMEMLRQLKEEESVAKQHTRYKTAKGEIREAEVWAESIELDGDRCVLGITRDVTEIQQLEAQLRQAQKMEAIGRLAGGVAHDFNNLLGVIIGYSDISLEKIAADNPASRYVSETKNAAQKAALLTQQLLAFSRKQAVFPKILDLNDVVRNATKMFLRLVGEDIDVEFRPTTPLGNIKVDPGQIEQVLMNLVVNARDAMPTGGRILIETSHAELDEHYVSRHPGAHAGQQVVLVVSDTGCGMDETTKSQIFDPFFTTKEVGKGTGLGLSTVYGIVKQSDGYIAVYSEPGRGTTFKIYFPVVREKGNELQLVHEDGEPPRGSETILVVEDDKNLREITVNLLRGGGYRVFEAKDAEQALRIISDPSQTIDLLLTDVIMPGKSGAELAKEANQRHPNLRSLFMSGYAGDLVRRQGVVLDEAFFLEKPFTKKSLLARVYSVLHR
jgi:PAS domain S-box-containing protein